MTRVQASCAYCGEVVWRKPSELKRAHNRGTRHFCCVEHRKAARFRDIRRDAPVGDDEHRLVALVKSANDRRIMLFWNKIGVRDSNTECWLWKGATGQRGYGHLTFLGVSAVAPQISFILHNGSLLKGQVIRHQCDNPPCCNPYHLIDGNHAQNSMDMVDRGRSLRGSLNPAASLTESDIPRIRSDSRPQLEIANSYGVTRSTIGLIKAKLIWRHI